MLYQTMICPSCGATLKASSCEHDDEMTRIELLYVCHKCQRAFTEKRQILTTFEELEEIEY